MPSGAVRTAAMNSLSLSSGSSGGGGSAAAIVVRILARSGPVAMWTSQVQAGAREASMRRCK